MRSNNSVRTVNRPPPFAAPDPVETLVQVRFHDPVSPRRVRPGIPRDLDTIVLKCLRKESNQRYSRAVELADDLDRFGNGQPVKARPIPVVVKLQKQPAAIRGSLHSPPCASP